MLSCIYWGALLALVLGNNAESSFRQAMLSSQGSVGILFSNGLVGGITTLALVMLFWPLIAKGLRSVRHPRTSKAPAEQPVD